jgi:aryl-alcohol dehydrogenase-like predicted oxidoreductase
VDLEGTRAVVGAALDAGVTFLDTADIYGGRPGESERLLGEALSGRHDEVAIATKFGFETDEPDEPDAPRGSPEYVRWAVEGSLRRLDVPQVELYQYHRPDGVTPIAETLGAMSALVDEGKVLHLGVSNVDAAQLREAQEAAGDRLVSVQNEYSLLHRGVEADVLPECERLGIGFLPYFPLSSGRLTGKYRRGEAVPEGTRLHGGREIADDETFDRLEAFGRFAEERGVEPVHVAIGWLLAQPAVASVIAGATKPEQVRTNAEALRWKPSDDDLAELDRIFPPGRS